ncbi:MAG: hypothetical protein ACOZFS_10170 [Thermodesulfobacteriota bacterium]
MRNKVVLFSALVVTLTVIFLMGCATTPSGSPATSQSDLLKQAGFKAHTPTKSQNLTYVQTLPAKKVVLNKYQTPVYLVCTDPDSKQCYLGNKAAYDRYQQLAIQQAVSEDQHKVSEERWDPEALQMWEDSQGGG